MEEKLKTLLTQLQSSGLPVVYRAWPKNQAPPLPFLCYMEISSSDFYADSGIYIHGALMQVELYTEKKDIDVEVRVEAALLPYRWEKTEIYIEEEQCYQIVYEFEV